MRKCVVLLLMMVASSAYGEIYTWKDARGTLYYTNSLYEIPARYRSRAKLLDVATGKKLPIGSAQPAQGGTPGAPAPSQQAPAQQAQTPQAQGGQPAERQPAALAPANPPPANPTEQAFSAAAGQPRPGPIRRRMRPKNDRSE